MKRILPLVRLVLCLFALFPFALLAQQKEPVNSLLWRISGNGLSKPSWLYGTIHLVDKRVFNFGDSLYAALEACEGYALEVDPDSIMTNLFKENKEEQELLKNVVSAKDFNRMKKKLQERFDKAPEKVTAKEFRDYFTATVNKPGKDAMPTIMDIWFYDAVHRQGKWVGGIEDVADQADVTENIPLSSYVEDFINDHRESKQTIEKMIKLYLAEDLEGVEKIEDHSGFSFKDKVMLRRNRKMAFRMDSLAHLRSTFFAVGLGHLPGDSGVISFLRRKGYTVSPVLSSTHIPATTYRFPVKEVPWVTATAASGNFTVQLPGEPQETGLVDESVDMKMYIDISTGLVYMAMSVEGNPNLVVDSLLAQMVRNMDKQARIAESRTVVHDKVQGREVVTKGGGAVYRARCFVRSSFVYVTLVGSSVDTLIRSADADRFFSSLVMHKKTVEPFTPWSAFTSDRHAFSLKFPGRPTIKKNPDEGSTVTTTVYGASDAKSATYFQCLVQEMKKGYFLTNDTALFGQYRDIVIENKDNHLLAMRIDTIQQYPAMWTTYIMKEDGNSFYNKVLNLHRGNRIYYLIATTNDSVLSKKAIQDFFASFSFLPPKESEWQVANAPDNSFTTWSATPVTPYFDTTDLTSKVIWFEAYDSTAPCTYFIGKSPYPANYWAEDDTSLLRRTVENYINNSDTLLSYTPVTNGNYRGVEVVIGLADNHNVKKMRLLIVGDTLFTIYGISTPATFALGNSRRLFTDFKVNHNTQSTIFSSKAPALLQSLHSTDSTLFTEAKSTLNYVTFAKSDLPLLHTAMLERYLDSSEYINVNGRLFNIVGSFKDESTLAYIKQVWEQLPPEKEALRYGLLGIVADHSTAASFALAKDLLLQHPPRKGEAYHLFNPLGDSLELTTAIFPALLPMLKDSLAAGHIIYLAESLLDSNLLDVREVLKYKEELYRYADKAIKNFQANADEPDWLSSHFLISLLTRLKEPAANQWVRKFLLQSRLSLKYSAAIALLKAGQPVEAPQLLKLAAEKEHRVDLYNELKKMQKIALFPKQYLTQQALAESELYDVATDEDELKKMTLIGERIAVYKGVRKKFYLYRMDMSYEDEKNILLGVAGPYNIKPGALVTGASAVGIYWDKQYNAATIDADLKAFLKWWEQYDKE